MASILLVEDDRDLSDTLKDYLEDSDFQVETAYTGPDALSKMLNGRFDLIVLDWQLPDMLGVDVVTKYRSDGGKDRVLMLTGNRDAAAREKGLKAGADDYLSKPFNLKQFSQRLQEMIDRPNER